MTFPFNKTLIPLLILITTWTGQSLSQELKIERKVRVESYLQDSKELLQRWRKVEDKLYRADFIVPPSFMGGTDPFTNPFADKSQQSINQSAKKILEEVGITFGKGAQVSYHGKTSILTVIQTPDQLELCEAYLAVYQCGSALEILIRAEIYELKTSLALKLLESCAGQSDHKPERDAIRQLMEKGDAKLIALPSIISRSGQRSKLISAYEVPFLTNAPQQKNSETKKTSPPLEIEFRLVGTIFEVDPVLGSDEWTIDLSFQLEHHTASPEFISANDHLKIPVFHSKEITTQVSLLKGNYLLVGTWKPTGKPEYEREDLMHVVFLTANVQGLRDYGVLLPAKGPNTNK